MKILGSDYDGTLSYNGVDERKRYAIANWRSKGNIFMLVSGRELDALLEICKNDSFECDYLIANNGAVIAKPDGSVLFSALCDGEIAIPLINYILEIGGLHAHVATELPFWVYKNQKDCDGEDKYTTQNLPPISSFTQISTICADSKTAERVTLSINEKFGEVITPLQNGRCIDIVKKGMNKAEGIHQLINLLGAEKKDVIVVGDNINDRDMIKEFRSYAMDNGVPAIKELADYTTPGVAELIEKELN